MNRNNQMTYQGYVLRGSLYFAIAFLGAAGASAVLRRYVHPLVPEVLSWLSLGLLGVRAFIDRSSSEWDRDTAPGSSDGDAVPVGDVDSQEVKG